MVITWFYGCNDLLGGSGWLAGPRIRIKSETAMLVVMPSCLCETACDSEHSSTTSGMRYLASVCTLFLGGEVDGERRCVLVCLLVWLVRSVDQAFHRGMLYYTAAARFQRSSSFAHTVKEQPARATKATKESGE